MPQLGLLLLLLVLLVLQPGTAHAGTLSCQDDFGGVIDGYDTTTYNLIMGDNNLTLAIDGSCTIQNWPYENGIPGFPATNINFYFPGGADYYLVFDNVYYDGNMSCNDPTNSNFWIYWAPGSFTSISDKCQAFMVPTDGLQKFNPEGQTSASIGVPFTYTIELPYLGQLDADGNFYEYAPYDDSDISNVVVYDDLTENNTAALSYIPGTAVGYLVDSGGNRTSLGPLATGGASAAWLDAHPLGLDALGNPIPRPVDATKHLIFTYENPANGVLATGVPAGYHLEIELQVVLDDDPVANYSGNTFTNTAGMWFDKVIEGTPVNDLYGWPDTTAPMIVAEPDLEVTKSSSTTTLNLGVTADFDIVVHNTGGATAWEASIVDTFPAGMCNLDPTSGAGVEVGVYDTLGTTLLRDLTEAVDYSISWLGDPDCELSLELLTADAALAPGEKLIISYSTQLDDDVVDGSTHTNVAVASQWYNNDVDPRKTYGPYISTDGSETYADAVTITATLSGYFFKKTVANLTTGETPATSAMPGDTLRYTLTLENFNIPTLQGVAITDDLGALNAAGDITSGSLSVVSYNFPGTVTTTAAGGTNGQGLIEISGFDLEENQQYQIQFDVTVGATPASSVIANQAVISGYDTGSAVDLNGVSDDPNVNGPIDLGAGGDITEVSLLTTSALQKQNEQTSATIGEYFSYNIRVPANPVDAPLYDVQIIDDLTATGVDLRFVSAEVQTGSSWLGAVTNTGTGSSDSYLVLQNDSTGIDIPANGYVDIKVTVELLNTLNNNAGTDFTNQASYSYDRTNGGGLRVTPASDPLLDTTEAMTVVEPLLAVSKAVDFVMPADKDPLVDPATAGDVLAYTVTMENTGTSTAYDVSVVDTLPGDVVLDNASATAQLYDPVAGTTTDVTGFIAAPTPLTADTVAWGDVNADGSLDIPSGNSLIVTYEVTVQSVTGTDVANSVYVDWTSLEGDLSRERTGTGCPTTTAPDDYCAGPAVASVTTQDNTALDKSASEDSYAEDPPSSGNPVVRVGDTVTYDLVLSLQEYTTQGVVVTDQLPAGMEFVSYTIDPGSTTFNYTTPLAAEPAAGATGTLTWNFGDIENVPSHDGTPVDPLLIRYVARVVTDDAPVGVDTSPSQTVENGAAITYTGYDPDNANLNDSVFVDILQPQMSAITKVDLLAASRSGSGTNADPYLVNLAGDVMSFQLQSCNVGGAPAYGVTVTDLLASQLDESDLSAAHPVVAVGPSGSETVLTETVDYTLTLPAARGGTLQIELGDTAPVAPGECVTISYDIGFHTDITTQELWSNEAQLTRYLSLPLSQSGRIYSPSEVAQVWMTNAVAVEPLSKVLTSATEATIGDAVSYTLTVPATPVNAALDNVVVSDTLHAALQYLGADAVDSGGNSVTLSDTTSGQAVSLGISTIPAGEQVTITLNTRVANNSDANAGVVIDNTAAYIYDGMTDPAQTQATATETVTLVEPELAIGKAVTPTTAPNAGDILTYTLTFTASGGAVGDNFSDAFDLQIDDSLDLGLEYVAGSATASSGAVGDPAVSGDGVTTAQTLVWSLGDGSADIDVAEGTVVTLSYDVRVLDTVVAGQTLGNAATLRWTGQQGVDANERTGSQSPAVNDYISAPATTSLEVLDNTTLTKTRLSDTWGTSDSDVRVGDLIEYELRIHLDEGSHSGLVLDDVLPQGLAFDSVVSINGDTAAPYEAVAPFSHTAIAVPSTSGDPATGSQTVTWNLGDVTNVGDNNPANDEFVIVYRAQVLNDVHPHVDSTALSNSATLTYTTATGSASRTDSETVALLQPQLAVTKSALPTGGDTFIEAGEVIAYTVELANSGSAPAYDAVVQDILPFGLRQGGVTTTAMTLVNAGTSLPVLVPAYDAVTGTVTWDLGSGTGGAYTIPAGETLRIEYSVTADADLGPGLTLENAVTATDYYSFDDEAVPAGAVTADREHYGPTNTARVTLTSPQPGAPLKENPAGTSVTIGELFTYTITVPQTPVATALHDVTISDDLSALGVDVSVVSIDKLSGSQTWVPVNTGSATGLVIEDTANGGIEIPANEQISIGITLRIENTVDNIDGDTFTNTASYTYNQIDDDAATVVNGGSSTTGTMTVVEPQLAVTKTATPLSTPVSGGSLIAYEIAIDNVGNATAHDINITDILPPELAYYGGFTPTATIDGSAVTGFVATPGGAPDGPLLWGDSNGDGSLDLPAGGQLLITYQAQVQVSTAASFTNEVWVDWTSLDGDVYERTGDGCPTTTAPDEYCVSALSAPVTVTDGNSLSKSVVADSYVDALSTADDATVRIGDTATYRLDLNLAEGTTANVSVSDVLPGGMEFVSLVGITSSAGGNFAYAGPTGPAAGATGTLTWDFGTITNSASNDGTLVDTLSIEYVARVLPDAGIAHTPSTTLTNTATLSYEDGTGTPVVDPARLESQATVTLWQPVMDSLAKTDRLGRIGTSATPLNVDVVNDTMQFRLQACNTTGLAPAYSLQLTDTLPPELDETTLTAPVVGVGGTVLAAGDYSYTPPAGSGGTIEVVLNVPVNPGECVNVDYDIGFRTDIAPNQEWNNSVTLDEYWSLPAASGQRYLLPDSAAFYMTNQFTVAPLAKSLTSANEATVADEVSYLITVPASPVNAALDNVVVSDTLDPALVYVSASAVDSAGNAVTLTDNTSGQDVSLSISQIPAGEQVSITLTTRVANNADANAGDSVVNSADYSYAGMPAGTVTVGTAESLTIIEPLIALTKSVVNSSNPGQAPVPDDILSYTLTFTASGGVAGDEFADVFDLTIEDTLGLGLEYVAGTTTSSIGSIGSATVVSGDGVVDPQELLWSPAEGNVDIDIAEGTVVTVSYEARVLAGVLPGQALTNNALARWTGQDGDNPDERTGSGTPVENDYFTAQATTTTRSELAITVNKSVVNATTGQDPGDNASPGDTLRYTIEITNDSVVEVTDLVFTDELDAHFVPGTLTLESVSTTADTTGTDPAGGSSGTGLISLTGMTLAPQGDASGNDTITIVFTAQLASVIDNGTLVYNQGQVSGTALAPVDSNEVSTLIGAAPSIEIDKTSEDLTDSPDVLMPGDTLRYTITVRNVGDEDATGVTLHDLIPANTTYVADSTTLNGVPVGGGTTSPLQDGMLINTPSDTTPGFMPADSTGSVDTLATITFEVTVNAGVVGGTLISNQGYLNGTGSGGVPFPETPSDDPGTSAVDDPTVDVVGDLPQLDAQKTVALVTDNNGNGLIDATDVLRYTITVTNFGAVTATGVVLQDDVPLNTTYVADTVYLNGAAVGQPDGGVSPLISGIPINSPDTATAGEITPGQSAVVTFEVSVAATAASGTVISNQGVVSSDAQDDEPTDADGNDSNGDQPTISVVGDAQQLAITKEVFDLNGGTYQPGDQLEYVVTVQNVGTVPAYDVVVTDNLDSPVADQLNYVNGSATLDGATTGVNVTTVTPITITANYGANYGPLNVGQSTVLRFRATLDSALASGTEVINEATVSWDGGAQSDTDSVSLIVGAPPAGSAAVSGTVWHDVDYSRTVDGGETPLADWRVELFRNGSLIATTTSDAAGDYQFVGLIPNDTTTATYHIVFTAPDATATTAAMGYADSPFTDGMQRIEEIVVSSGSSISGLNMPIMPNGVVYNSMARTPVGGATVRLLDAASGQPLAANCFDDATQQGQVTLTGGHYRFDLNFSDPSCPAGGTYLLRVTPPAGDYEPTPVSRVIPPQSDETTAAFSVPACLGSGDDAIPATGTICEVVTLASEPPLAVAARTAGTDYYLHLQLDNGLVPGESQLFNNHIPLDPILNEAVAISKTSSKVNVSRGDMVPYTITVNNGYLSALQDLTIVDNFPAGFKYVEGSARYDGGKLEPIVVGNQLRWENIDLATDTVHTIRLLLVVSSGVSEGEYVNRAQVINSFTASAVSGEASATVRVVPDPTFDCTDVIGKVFDDKNLNGVQDTGEKGIPNTRVVTARGLIVTSDEHGRFHVTCAAVPDEVRGSNFILKLDERSLPSGYRVTTENPRVQRITRGKMSTFNFGATIHRVVRLDVADGVFESDSTTMRRQWRPRVGLLLEQLQSNPSILRISYLADVEDASLVKRRLDALEAMISDKWMELECCYKLTIETEIYWRRGAPVKRKRLLD